MLERLISRYFSGRSIHIPCIINKHFPGSMTLDAFNSKCHYIINKHLLNQIITLGQEPDFSIHLLNILSHIHQKPKILCLQQSTIKLDNQTLLPPIVQASENDKFEEILKQTDSILLKNLEIVYQDRRYIYLFESIQYQNGNKIIFNL